MDCCKVDENETDLLERLDFDTLKLKLKLKLKLNLKLKLKLNLKLKLKLTKSLGEETGVPGENPRLSAER